MSTTTMTFKIDKTLKQSAQMTADNIGVPLSTLLNAYLRQFTATGRVELSATETMTAQTEKIIENFKKEVAAGDVSPTFTNAEDAINYLKSL